MGLVVAAHDHDLVAALQLRYRALRDEQGAFPRVELHAHAGKLAGAKSIARIGEQRFHAERAGARVDLAVNGIDSAFARIGCSVGENQLQFKLSAALGADGFIRKQSREVDVSLFGDTVIDLDRVERRNRC